jgi:hypothetical protein
MMSILAENYVDNFSLPFYRKIDNYVFIQRLCTKFLDLMTIKNPIFDIDEVCKC